MSDTAQATAPAPATPDTSIMRWTTEQLTEYVGSGGTPHAVTDLGDIFTCIKVIGAHESGPERNDELVMDAVVSLHEWLGDYGVSFQNNIITLD